MSRPIGLRKRWMVLDRDAFTCRYCGQQAPDVVLEVDHIVPRVASGSDDLDNLVTACFDCNRGKKAWDSTEPLEVSERIAIHRENEETMVGIIRRMRRESREWPRERDILISEVAYRADMTIGDVIDWLTNELYG